MLLQVYPMGKRMDGCGRNGKEGDEYMCLPGGIIKTCS
jgi:hypothetical protein